MHDYNYDFEHFHAGGMSARLDTIIVLRKIIPKKLWDIVSEYSNSAWETCLTCIEYMARDWQTIEDGEFVPAHKNF